MRYLILFLLSLLPAFSASAQKRFSKQQFDKLKRLSAAWLVSSNKDLPIYEEWEIINDTLLNGILYRVSDNTHYLPELSMTLFYSNRKIKIACAYPDKNNQIEKIDTFELRNIERGRYYFANTADTFPIQSRKSLKETFLSSIAYDCSGKDQIIAQRQYIVPGKGLSTIHYVFKKE